MQSSSTKHIFELARDSFLFKVGPKCLIVHTLLTQAWNLHGPSMVRETAKLRRSNYSQPALVRRARGRTDLLSSSGASLHEPAITNLPNNIPFRLAPTAGDT
jgi:hypothetical protein